MMPKLKGEPYMVSHMFQMALVEQRLVDVVLVSNPDFLTLPFSNFVGPLDEDEPKGDELLDLPPLEEEPGPQLFGARAIARLMLPKGELLDKLNGTTVDKSVNTGITPTSPLAPPHTPNASSSLSSSSTLAPPPMIPVASSERARLQEVSSIAAHRVILSLHSPVFASMFTSSIPETSPSFRPVIKLNVPTMYLAATMEIIYFDTWHILRSYPSILLGFYTFAENYQV